MLSPEEKLVEQRRQIEQAERLQRLILDDLERCLNDKTATATDRATIIRLLKDNGWTLDPAQLPSNLKAMLIADLSAVDVADELAERRRRTG